MKVISTWIDDGDDDDYKKKVRWEKSLQLSTEKAYGKLDSLARIYLQKKDEYTYLKKHKNTHTHTRINGEYLVVRSGLSFIAHHHSKLNFNNK